MNWLANKYFKLILACFMPHFYVCKEMDREGEWFLIMTVLWCICLRCKQVFLFGFAEEYWY